MKFMKNIHYLNLHKKNESRIEIWKGICKYIQKEIARDSTVLDLGCGYCGFINEISAKNKFATDINSEFQHYANSNVTFITSKCSDLSWAKNKTFDTVFTSNLFEHLTEEEVFRTIQEIQRILKEGGKIIVLQPNFYYCYKEYFHDCTHRLIFTHVGLSDLLRTNNFCILKCIPRFLPFSLQSKYSGIQIPKLLLNRYIVYLYLLQPWKIFSKQMYIVGEKL